MATWIALFVLSLSLSYTQIILGCNELEVRLGEDGGNSGLVEVCIDNEWRSVVSQSWGNEEATVVCRQLGFDFGFPFSSGTLFSGLQNATITLINVTHCSGSEEMLADCMFTISIIDTSNQILLGGVGAMCGCNEFEVRLGEDGGNSGLVEVCIENEWRSVVSQSWGDEEATVVCRQFGFGFGVPISQETLPGSGLQPSEDSTSLVTVINVTYCSGFERILIDCAFILDETTSEPIVRVGAMCFVFGCNAFEVRLGEDGGNSGLVEVCIDNEWRSVTSQSWGNEEATVVCIQLGFDGGVPISQETLPGSGLQPSEDSTSLMTVLTVTQCSGFERMLTDCEFILGETTSEPIVRVGAMCSVCNNSAARLVDGPSPSEGRLEVCGGGGLWGTVCDDLWGIRETLVACKQMEYTSGEFITESDRLAPSSQVILLDNVFCNGSESNLLECDFLSSSDCRHSEDVHLKCSSPVISVCNESETRLAGGSKAADGFLEVCLSGQWYPVEVCINEWDARDSRVVCRLLGYPTGIPNYVFEVFLGTHEGSDAVILNDVRCNGTEPHLFSCKREVGADQYCSRIRAGVTCTRGCTDNDIRIIGSSAREGRVQFCYRGEWGGICDCNSSWSDANADVVCRNLDLGTGFALDAFVGRSAPVVLSDVVCDGSESTLAECSRGSIGPQEGEGCQDFDVGVICQDPRCERNSVTQSPDGVISLCNSAFIMSSVCANFWDASEATVACKDLTNQLEASEAIAISVENSNRLQGRASIDCQQNFLPNSIFDCSINETIDSCDGGLAGVICDLDGFDECTDSEVRLVNDDDGNMGTALAGRVQFCYRGLWGSVCSDGFDDVDAGVVCRQLGFASGSRNVTVAPLTYGPILLSGLECNGTESGLANCNHSGINIHNCSNHTQDALVSCIECISTDVRLIDPESGLPLDGSEGQVQVCVNESWATVGGRAWEMEDAEVVCRQLGFDVLGSGVNPLARRYLDGILDGIVLSEFDCAGDEDSILQCDYNFTSATVTYGGVRCQGLDDLSTATPTFAPASSNAIAIAVGIVGGILLLIVVGFILPIIFICRQKHGRHFGSHHTIPNTYLASSPGEGTGTILSRRYASITQKFPEDLLIPADTIRLLDSIGQGEFGIVYKAHLVRPHHSLEEKLFRMRSGTMPDKFIAVKTLHGHFNEGDISETLRESAKMKDFNHPNVLSMLGICVDAGPAPYIVMPFMSNGSLHSYLRKERASLTLPLGTDPDAVGEIQKKLVDMCMQIAKGMEYLASKSFIHRDLASRNCMIDSIGIIKVADFGLSENTYSKTYFRQGKNSSVKLPIKWMAPESINDGIFSEKSDVWAFGVTFWEVFTGAKTPYPGQHPQVVITLIENGERLQKPTNAACSDQIYSIMLSCWEASPDDRPAFTQLVQSIANVLEGLADYFTFNTFSAPENSCAVKQEPDCSAPPVDNNAVHDTTSAIEHSSQSLSGDPASSEADSTTSPTDERHHRPEEDYF